MTKLLLEKDINVNVKDVFGKPAIFMLFQQMTGKFILKSSSTLCQKPMLHSEEDIKDVVSMLVSHGLDVNLFDSSKNSVLDIICSSGRQPKAGIILLNAGADPTRSNCFQKAITTNNAVENADWEEFIQLLLQKGCDPNVFNGDTSNLIHVTKKRLIGIVEKLIKHGANVNFCTSEKKTALHYACELTEGSARDDIVRLLVKSGAKLNIQTSSGESPLYILVNTMIDDVKYNKAEGDESKRVIKKEIDLSSFNRLVCGGSQLKDVKISDSTDMETRDTFLWEFPIGDLDENVTKSALQLLIKNGFLNAAMCLLESGWEFKREKWFENLDLSIVDLSNIKIEGSFVIYKRLEIENAKSEFQTFIRNTQFELQSLAQCCRRVIRNNLLETSNGSEIESKVEVLPVPTKIKSFLTLVDNCHESEIFLLENILRPRNCNQFQPTYLHSSLITSDSLEMDTDDEGTSYFMNDYGSDDNYVYAHDDDLSDDDFMFSH
ncbi:uncharacterized protein LOC127704237 [Mytilus californianus]|uniref:uncharacterized protein LOC127704237 n=1 Tax=Mytilus californianus TaxID=6549 RepID=UPI002246698D|nr:uncharacterized protein LOC127704237 [Mytilus californianus]